VMLHSSSRSSLRSLQGEHYRHGHYVKAVPVLSRLWVTFASEAIGHLHTDHNRIRYYRSGRAYRIFAVSSQSVACPNEDGPVVLKI
jgi:hypothetical protein